ncbi:MAG: hypothetical protein Q9190_007388 [Brigantiaea leucoxantha]
MSIFQTSENADAIPFTSVLSIDLTGLIDEHLVHVASPSTYYISNLSPPYLLDSSLSQPFSTHPPKLRTPLETKHSPATAHPKTSPATASASPSSSPNPTPPSSLPSNPSPSSPGPPPSPSSSSPTCSTTTPISPLTFPKTAAASLPTIPCSHPSSAHTLSIT